MLNRLSPATDAEPVREIARPKKRGVPPEVVSVGMDGVFTMEYPPFTPPMSAPLLRVTDLSATPAWSVYWMRPV